MTALSDTSFFSRRAIFFAGAALAAVIAFLIIFNLIKLVGKTIFPPKSAPPTVAFGKLPKIDLSEGISAKITNVSLETVSGELPNLPTELKVFAITGEEPSFGAIDNTKKTAAKMGFRDEPQLESGNLVNFFATGKLNKQLRLNTTTGNFTYETDFKKNQDLYSLKARSSQDAIAVSDDFFRNFSLDRTQFPKDKVSTRLLRLDGLDLTEVSAISEANLIEVNYSRADIDKLSVMKPRVGNSDASLIVAGGDVVKAILNKQNIAFNQFSTYPLKGVKVAFEEFKAGGAVFNKPPKQDFPIRDVNLAYLETDKPQSYLQPVYVFSSDNGLAGFVDAISSVWVIP